MAYLNGNTITVDAILTRYGKKMLAQKNGFQISKYSFSDDGVDYGMYNTGNPTGSEEYGAAIKNMPQLEAVTADHANIKYHLLTWDIDKAFIPRIVLSPTVVDITESGVDGTETITLKTKHGPQETYTARVLDASGLIMVSAPMVTDVGGETRNWHHMQNRAQDVIAGPFTEFKIQAGPIITKKSTAVIFYGNTTGAVAVARVNLPRNIYELQPIEYR